MKWLFAFLLALAAPAFAANGLLEHTAVNALRAAKHTSTGTQLEHGGMLISRDTPYGRTLEYVEPTAEGKEASVTVIDRTFLHKGDVLVGTYHLHLCMFDYYHQYFSRQDVITAIFSGVPEYMLDECTGLVHVFDPKVDKVHGPGSIEAHITTPDGKGARVHLPMGRIIEDIGEIEPMHKDST